MVKIVDQAPMQSPISPFDPNADMDVKRKRKLAEMLMKQGEQPQGTEMVSGVAVRQSPLSGLARALTQGFAGYTEGKANQAEAKMQQDKMARMAAAIQSGKFDSLAQGSPDEQMLALKAKMDADAEARKFAHDLQMKKMSSSGLGGATGALADRLIEAGVPTIDAIMIAKSGVGVGNTYANGGINPMAGKLDTALATKQAEQTGTNLSDLEYKPEIKSREKTAELNAQKLSDLETSNAGLDEFEQSANRLGTAVNETPSYQTGQVGGRFARLISAPERSNLDSALNETTLRAKVLLNMPSNNFSDADREFLTEISGGKYAKHGGYTNVLKRMERMVTSQRNINSKREQRITGQPAPNQTPQGKATHKWNPQTGQLEPQ